jgi:glycosyltransferase involved in cell wall biosynthesis
MDSDAELSANCVAPLDRERSMDHPNQHHRKLLIITYHFPPSGAVAVFRMLGFARHLPRFGWQVGVVAPPTLPYEPVDEALLQRVPRETEVFPAAFPRSLPARLAGRFFYNGVWLPRALPAVMRAVKCFKPDVVLTSGPPHCVHFLGFLLKHCYRLPWVATLRDPWYTNSVPCRGWFPWARWEGFWEGRMVRTADCIIANTPFGGESLQRAYEQQRHKIKVVTNGFDAEFFPAPQPLVPLNPRLTILHAGELYGGRDPRPFFDALVALDKARPAGQAPVRMILLGQSTDSRFDMHSILQERGLQDTVEMGGQVPYAAALEAMSRSDILLLLDSPGRRVGIPAKLFEYLGAGRPILALTEANSDGVWALEASGCPHRIAPPLDATRILQALTELRDGLQTGTLTAPSPRQVATFTRGRLAEQLALYLDGVVAKRSSGRAPEAVPMLSLIGHDAPERLTATPPTRRAHYLGA